MEPKKELTPAQKDAQIQEAAENKAAALSQTLGVKVHPIIFKETETGEPVIGYIKEPARIVKLRAMDKGAQAPFTTAAELFDSIVVREETDAKILSEDSENDKFYIGAVNCAYALIQASVNQFKKK